MVDSKKTTYLLLVGDIAVLLVALAATLGIAYFPYPESEIFFAHVSSFGWLFFVWGVVFFIAGLYDATHALFRREVARTVLYAHVANGILAALFFYTVPYFGITPKTNLFIYLALSLALLLLWRVYGVHLLAVRGKQKAILVGSGDEISELKETVNSAPHLALEFVSSQVPSDDPRALASDIVDAVRRHSVSLVVADLQDERVEAALAHLSGLLTEGVQFIDASRVYESAFHRIPLSLVHHHWIFEHITPRNHALYDTLKRMMDLVGATVVGLPSLALYPFVVAALLGDEGSGVFSVQKRVGKGDRTIRLVKFRTMLFTDDGRWDSGNENRVTRVGAFLRKTRLDELPQLWNVLRGDISLIGPRPEFPDAVRRYGDAIPYYGLRHIIKPGLSGWAQIHHEKHPHHGIDITETKNKLSYDLYYLKNRSFLLDVEIALKTVKTLLSRGGA